MVPKLEDEIISIQGSKANLGLEVRRKAEELKLLEQKEKLKEFVDKNKDKFGADPFKFDKVWCTTLSAKHEKNRKE